MNPMFKTMREFDDFYAGYVRSLKRVAEFVSKYMITLEQLMRECMRAMNELYDAGCFNTEQFKRMKNLMHSWSQELFGLKKFLDEVEESKLEFLRERKNNGFMQPGSSKSSGLELRFKNLGNKPMILQDSVSEKTSIDKLKEPINENPESSNSLSILDGATSSTVERRRVVRENNVRIINLPAQPNFPDVLPREFINRIQEIGGSLDKLVLIIKKKLFKSDLSEKLNRLTIPHGQVLNRFLTPSEEADLDIPKKIKTTLIQPCLEECEIFLSNWKSNSEYALITSWNDVTRRNGLRTGMNIQLWSFRRNLDLCFALVIIRED